MITDPIADMLTRIRNANQALLPSVEVSYSQMKESIANILKHEGYIQDVAISSGDKKTIILKLKFQGRKGVIEGLKRVSRPGLRNYVGAQEIPRVLGGLGVSILSTSKGILTGTDARRKNIGGEVLCFIW